MRHGVRDDECIFLAGSFLDMCPCMEQITSKSVTCANFYEHVEKKITKVGSKRLYVMQLSGDRDKIPAEGRW